MLVFILEVELTGIGDDLDEEGCEEKGRIIFGYYVPFDRMRIIPSIIKPFFFFSF